MLEVKSKRIGDNTYKVTQLGAKKGRAVLVRIMNSIGHGLAEVVEKGHEGAIQAISAICENLRTEDLDFVCDAMAENTRVVLVAQFNNGSKEIEERLDFDSQFAGHYWDMLEWLAFTLEVNFADFFDSKRLGTLMSQVGGPPQQPTKSKHQSQPGSIGGSGGSQAPNESPPAS